MQLAVLASKRVKYSVEHFGRGLESVCFVFQNAEDVKNDRMSNQILSINSGDAHSMSSEELASLPLQVGDLFSSPPTHLVATYSLLHLLT